MDGAQRLASALGVLLLGGLLGCASDDEQALPVSEGIWAARGFELHVHVTGAQAILDCARGTVDETLVIDDDGEFIAGGTYTTPVGPPTPPLPETHAAVYSGRVDGDIMHLSIRFTDTGEQRGPYTFTFGQSGDLLPCQ